MILTLKSEETQERMDNTGSDDPPKTVQHVNKKSSDELLKKFANEDDKEEAAALKKKENARRVSKRIKDRRRESDHGVGASSRSLLLTPVTPTRRSTFLRQLGIGKSHQDVRAREIRNKSIMLTLEKTWRKTLEGASKVFLDKHYNRHRRLINDV